jgi:hypothetical protein
MKATRPFDHAACGHALIDHVEEACAGMSLGEIAALDDLTFRNRCITATYHRLSRETSALVAPGNAVWVTYAGWASEQAGRSIRRENLPLARWNPLGYADRVAAVISAGNLKVFVEIAPLFERFVAWMRDPSPARVGARAAALASGLDALLGLVRAEMALDPRPLSEHPGGQALLIGAFAAYVEASVEADPDLRAEYVFLANGLVGLHEQTRVDPEVLAALEAPELDPVAALWARAAGSPLGEAVRAGASRLAARAPAAFELAASTLRERLSPAALATQMFMRLRVGADDLALAEDLRPADGPAFPPQLARIDNCRPEFLSRLAVVLAYDRTPDTLDGSAARDWTRLDDRMNFIVDLFRSRQQTAALFEHPLRASVRARGAG